MIYKMYKMIFKEEPDLSEEDPYFAEMYEKHDVTVVGEWINSDNPKEAYFITVYRDEDHYNQFVEATRNDQKYQELTKAMSSTRDSVEMVNLKSLRE